MWTGATWNWVSGAWRRRSTRAKPPDSARLEAKGPVWEAVNSSSAAGSSASSRLSGSGVVQTPKLAAWSLRFSPTAGWSSSSSTSRSARCSAGPTPESISSCGEL